MFLFAGYGHIVPKTPVGKIFTIFYAVIGIPLFLLYLSNIGQIFATSLKWTYSRLCKCQILRRHRRLMFQDKNLNFKSDFLLIGNTESRIFLPRYILAWWTSRRRKTPRRVHWLERTAKCNSVFNFRMARLDLVVCLKIVSEVLSVQMRRRTLRMRRRRMSCPRTRWSL